jgi:hypothetical protein
MSQIAKKVTQDGTFTVYLASHAIAWGLTSAAADALIQRLIRLSTPMRITPSPHPRRVSEGTHIASG